MIELNHAMIFQKILKFFAGEIIDSTNFDLVFPCVPFTQEPHRKGDVRRIA